MQKINMRNVEYGTEAGEFARTLRRSLTTRGVRISEFKEFFPGREKDVNAWLRDGTSGHKPLIPDAADLMFICMKLDLDHKQMQARALKSEEAISEDIEKHREKWGKRG